jgi:hypothetical protein
MLLDDPDVLAVLRNLYRVRSATVQEFAALDSLPTARLDEILALLEGSGYLIRDGDQLTPVSPDAAVSSALLQTVTDQQRSLASAASLLDALPLLARDWELGEAGAEYTLSAEIVHGHRAQWEAWRRYSVQYPPRAPICLYPDLEVLRDVVAPDILRMQQEGPVTVPVRAVLPAALCADPASQPTLETLMSAGMQIRTLARVPYWIYADDGVVASLAVTWHEHPPNSILLIRQPSIVSALAYAVSQQWQLAEPYPAETDGWAGVLHLLSQGLSDPAIASALGISMRTVQRRIGEAMAELGAASRFELGVAYERDRAARG